MRTVLDPVDPEALRPATVDLVQELQKQGVLESVVGQTCCNA